MFEFKRVEEGRCRETTLQVNYLATALLAILLLPVMKPSAVDTEPGRLTLIGSDAALTAPLPDPGEGHSLLDSSTAPKSSPEFVRADDVIVNVSNPGATRGTELIAKGNGPVAVRLFTGVMFGVLGRSAADAARIYVHSSLVLGRESHGSYTEWVVRAWPPMMYTEAGRRLGDRLWDETMKELSFAKVEEVLEGMKG
ncbi:Retinol dehydrogenase 12 [Apiospora phragmitis]|uniref:Retinol dehydrogenase 12 n=1 Tax=Apiospora phragmitis TaxID=2905665 RepID=A0ABR1UGY0_9PEZI